MEVINIAIKTVKEIIENFLLNEYREETKILQQKNGKHNLYVDSQRFIDFFNENGNDIVNFPKLDEVFNIAERHINTYEGNKLRNVKDWISFKIKDFPTNALFRELDSDDNNRFISTRAMIKSITDIVPKLEKAEFECTSCMRLHTVKQPSLSTDIKEPSLCPECGGRRFRLLTDMSEYTNQRYVLLEEPIESRVNGKTRELLGYLDGSLAIPGLNLNPGDVVDVSGVFKVKAESKKGRGKKQANSWSFILNVHNINALNSSFENLELTADEEVKILELSNEPDVFERFIHSLSPSTLGHEEIKKGLILQMFEGDRPKDQSIKNIPRYTIHILLMGDPGLGKSTLLKDTEYNAPKVINSAGTGSSKVGLTVSANRDDITGAWSLEAGAVVMADSGTLIVDEFDKLGKGAMNSLNEAMEQMSVSSAKAGIIGNMISRTNVLAAANPKYGKMDDYKDMKVNINIPAPVLSRFDLIYIMRDKIDPEKDYNMAMDLMSNNINADSNVELIEENLFKKYIMYAKKNCFPVLTKKAMRKIAMFYKKVRQAAEQLEESKPITPREMRVMQRLAVARAKIELRDEVTVEDAEEAIDIYVQSLSTLGLDPLTAGEIEDVSSSLEARLRNDIEEAINIELEENNGVLSQEGINNIINDINALNDVPCNIDVEVLFKQVYENSKIGD